MQDCYSSLNSQWFSQLLMTLVKIIQNWWKHEAGLQWGLEEAAKSLLSSMREMLMSLCLPVAWCGLASPSYCIKLGYMKLFELHILAIYLPKIKHQRQHDDSRAKEEFFMVGLLLRKRECEACVLLLSMCCSISETRCCQSGESSLISKC